MAQPDFQPLNKNQQAAMLDLFSALPDQIIETGENLWIKDKVNRLGWRTPGLLLTGQVYSRHHHQVTVQFSADGSIFNLDCSCKLRGYCPHVVAMLLAASATEDLLEDNDAEDDDENEGEDYEDEDYEDEDYEDEDYEDEEEEVPEDQAARDAARRHEKITGQAAGAAGRATGESENLDSAAKDSGAKDSGAKDSGAKDSGAKDSGAEDGGAEDGGVKDGLSSTAPVSLTAYLEERIGRPLRSGESELVKRIELLWRENVYRLEEADLLSLGGHSRYFYSWNRPVIEIWAEHRPPASGVEAFHYVAHALRERNRLPSMILYRSVDWEAVEELVQRWQREKQIQQWRRHLGAISLASQEAPPSPVFRLRLSTEGAVVEWTRPGTPGFVPTKPTLLRQLGLAAQQEFSHDVYFLDDTARRFLVAIKAGTNTNVAFEKRTEAFEAALNRLLRQPGSEAAVVSPDGEPLIREAEPLQWVFQEPVVVHPEGSPPPADADYEARLCTADGRDPGPPLATLEGWPSLFVTPDRIYQIRDRLTTGAGAERRLRIPVDAVESPAGVAGLLAMNVRLPDRLAARVQSVVMQVTVRCRLRPATRETPECFEISARAHGQRKIPDDSWNGTKWEIAPPPPDTAAPKPDAPILTPDRRQELATGPWLASARCTRLTRDRSGTAWAGRPLTGAAQRTFPEEFLDWLAQSPDGVAVELDPELASLRNGTVAGKVRLDMQEAQVDWFDLKVALDVSDVELSSSEIDLLLKAQGRWVRLPDKGWRRLEFQLSDEEQSQLADLGLAVGDLAKSEPQRLHVFQLAGAAGTRLLPPERAIEVKRRAEELRTSVTPEIPAAITASLRPYQREGYHFLAYLSANRFGGILADDMGLGKTVQTLTWLAWLRETGQLNGQILVICPKSVQANWSAEVARFCPGLTVRVWSRETAGEVEPASAAPARKTARKKNPAAAAGPDLLIINYTQLRLHEEILRARPWAAVVLDEAQYIKNPSSQTTKAACALQAGHRLALSGTPIENRLLDLWSIMQFAMPGVLGNRTAFNRNFNGKDDPLARRRLAARVRPFVLRRTKTEVARDLPDRTEEEIVCELEGPQATLYRAELKRARAVLLKAKTASQLDKLRFNILTSLLRLRQICCHPMLVGAGSPEDESAKLAALLDLLEPLMEEGHKVLVFSQFVEMLELIRLAALAREWPHLVLTGQTEDRGALVDTFQRTEGASIFLISLKAGGFGLNLTAASYVVLFDPWWNPAVENQAIDRTHRIGQTNKVIAYRLLARDTIEEKIRELQKKKSALASDILGEESFAKALSLDDFRFLLGDGDAPAEA